MTTPAGNSCLAAIRDAELETAARVAWAHEASAERVAAARRQAAQLVAAARERGTARARVVFEAGLTRTAAEADGIRRRGRERADSLGVAVEPLLDDVAAAVVDYVLPASGGDGVCRYV